MPEIEESKRKKKNRGLRRISTKTKKIRIWDFLMFLRGLGDLWTTVTLKRKKDLLEWQRRRRERETKKGEGRKSPRRVEKIVRLIE